MVEDDEGLLATPIYGREITQNSECGGFSKGGWGRKQRSRIAGNSRKNTCHIRCPALF